MGGSPETPVGAPPLSLVRSMFDGEYLVRRCLGWSPSAAVYQGERDGEHVALAVLPIDCEGAPRRRDGFERAARELAWLDHPSVAPVRCYGVSHEVPWVEWQLVEGRSLAEQLRLGPLSRDRALGVALDVLEALASAHASGIVHGDLTPGQVLFTDDGIRLVGLGLAPMIHAFDGKRLPARPGRETYLAPEVVAGARPDARSDIYSVGALIYHMFLDEPPPPPPAVSAFTGNAMLPVDLEPLLVSALSVDPKQRYSSAEEMMREVAHALGAKRALSSRPPPAKRRKRHSEKLRRPKLEIPPDAGRREAQDETARIDTPRVEGARRRTRRGVLVLAPVAAALVVGLAIAGWAILRAETGDPADLATATLDTAAFDSARRADAPAGAEAAALAEAPAAVQRAPEFEVHLPAGDANGESDEAGLDEGESVGGATQDALATVDEELVAYRDLVRNGERLEREDLAAIYRFAQGHPDDPAPHILLAEAFMDLGWHTDAIERIRHATTVAPQTRHHPMMLESLVLLTYQEWTSLDAADAIVEIFGAEAIPAVDAAIASEPDAVRLSRFESLRRRLGDG